MPPKKDPNKPRGRMTGYAYFVQTCREEHKRKHPSEQIVFTEFSKKCAKRWKVSTSFPLNLVYVLCSKQDALTLKKNSKRAISRVENISINELKSPKFLQKYQNFFSLKTTLPNCCAPIMTLFLFFSANE